MPTFREDPAAYMRARLAKFREQGLDNQGRPLTEAAASRIANREAAPSKAASERAKPVATPFAPRFHGGLVPGL